MICISVHRTNPNSMQSARAFPRQPDYFADGGHVPEPYKAAMLMPRVAGRLSCTGCGLSFPSYLTDGDAAPNSSIRARTSRFPIPRSAASFDSCSFRGRALSCSQL
jgi:hypothetical protein